ncbi:MAG: S41 family peptidase [Flavobacteriales bacterium]|nr:S41 family peptidase [Flavobacteriales bacterium]
MGWFLHDVLNFENESPVTFFSQPNNGDGLRKLNKILGYIEKDYVDTVDMAELSDIAINSVLEELDPHSSYINANRFKSMDESLKGNYEGIGIEFNILNDTILVIWPITGGPSEMLGLLAGDRIIEIDTQLVAGTGITSKDVVAKLKGESGTKVQIGIKRKGVDDLLIFDITRKRIPLNSVEISYMINENTGYIKVSKFSATTYKEVTEAIENLSKNDLANLIFDLRGNGGGYLDAAINISDEFLPQDYLIVSTKGRSRAENKFYARRPASFTGKELIILIDEGSASASEIVTGAVQDNDVGLIVGRRSFGKGLVNEQHKLFDGSVVRLTTQRYYSPSGRCIQKPYGEGNEKYYEDYHNRYKNGELMNQDSIDFPDSLIYETRGGRVVYGGGGIMPDIYVPLDTTKVNNSYVNYVMYSGLVIRYAFQIIDKDRAKIMEQYDLQSFIDDYKISDEIFKGFKEFIIENDGPESKDGDEVLYPYLKTYIKANIGRNLWSSAAYYPVVHSIDDILLKALETVEK